MPPPAFLFPSITMSKSGKPEAPVRINRRCGPVPFRSRPSTPIASEAKEDRQRLDRRQPSAPRLYGGLREGVKRDVEDSSPRHPSPCPGGRAFCGPKYAPNRSLFKSPDGGGLGAPLAGRRWARPMSDGVNQTATLAAETGRGSDPSLAAPAGRRGRRVGAAEVGESPARRVDGLARRLVSVIASDDG